MTVQLTDAQLTTLINRLVGAAGGASQGAASAVGPMEPCNLGIDKVKRLKNFQDWCKEAEAKITYMGINEDTKKGGATEELGREGPAQLLGERSPDTLGEDSRNSSSRGTSCSSGDPCRYI